MKTYCKHLKVDYDFIAEAFEEWTTKEAGHKNLWRVYYEYGCPENLIRELADEMKYRVLSFAPIHRYWHQERQGGKYRLIGVESVKQQIFDYVLNKGFEPIYKAKVGFWQVGSVPGKGMIMAKKDIEKNVKKYRWNVHLDIHHDYRETLLDVCYRILCKYCKSPDLLYGARVIFSTYDEGLEIGSPFSLKMNLLDLSCAYHAVEDMHVVHRGEKRKMVEHQLWYMDDIFLFSNRKKDLLKAIRYLADFLYGELGLTLKKWKIASCFKETVDTMAFRVARKTTKLRRNIFIRAARAFERFRLRRTLKLAYRVVSYWGYIKHARLHKFISDRNAIRLVADAKNVISICDRRRGANEHRDKIVYRDFSNRDLADGSWLRDRVA